MLLQPPLLSPAGPLLFWASSKQPLRLLGRPWRQGGEDTPLSSAEPPGAPGPDLCLHSSTSSQDCPPSLYPQPVPTVLYPGDSGDSGLEKQWILPPALVTCPFSVPPRVSWSSALCCLKGRVTGSEACPVPQPRSSQAGFGVDFNIFGQMLSLLSPCSLLLGKLLLYSFGFLPSLRHLNV